MGCDFSYSKIFLGEVRHNKLHQFFHKHLISWIIGDLLDVQFLRLFKVLDILLPALLDILYQQLQVLGVERFGDIGVRSPQIPFCMVVFIRLGSQEDGRGYDWSLHLA